MKTPVFFVTIKVHTYLGNFIYWYKSDIDYSGIQNIFYFHFFLFFFQSSLDRGCFSCECLLISENQEGLQFWRRRVGSEKIDRLLEDQQNSRQELFIELSKTEMSTFYQQTDPELWAQISKANNTQSDLTTHYHIIIKNNKRNIKLWSQTLSRY